MADSYLRQPTYARYKPDVKEDMRMAALEKCIRSIRNYKPERRATCFGYYTLAIQSAVLDYLRRFHYRHINITREATRRYAHELAHTNPQAAQKILDGLLEANTTDTLNDAQKNRNRHNRRK
jgi:DNA-directed RNA polymerase specialized sigma subunit